MAAPSTCSPKFAPAWASQFGCAAPAHYANSPPPAFSCTPIAFLLRVCAPIPPCFASLLTTPPSYCKHRRVFIPGHHGSLWHYPKMLSTMRSLAGFSSTTVWHCTSSMLRVCLIAHQNQRCILVVVSPHCMVPTAPNFRVGTACRHHP